MTRNKIYQFLWYKVFKRFVPTCPGVGPFQDDKRIRFMLSLAKTLCPIHGIIIGDSEGAMFDNYETMSKFESLVLNLAEGGMRPIDWIRYLATTGKDVYEIIRTDKIKKINSIGGNCSLQNHMDELPRDMQTYHDLLGGWILLLPPVHTSWLAAVTPKTDEQWIEEMKTVRGYQRAIYGAKIIDIYTPFIDPATGEAIAPELRDPVHVSTIAVNLLEKVFNQLT